MGTLKVSPCYLKAPFVRPHVGIVRHRYINQNSFAVPGRASTIFHFSKRTPKGLYKNPLLQEGCPRRASTSFRLQDYVVQLMCEGLAYSLLTPTASD